MGSVIVPSAALLNSSRGARWKSAPKSGSCAVEVAKELIERAALILEREGGEAARVGWLLEDCLGLLDEPMLDTSPAPPCTKAGTGTS